MRRNMFFCLSGLTLEVILSGQAAMAQAQTVSTGSR